MISDLPTSDDSVITSTGSIVVSSRTTNDDENKRLMREGISVRAAQRIILITLANAKRRLANLEARSVARIDHFSPAVLQARHLNIPRAYLHGAKEATPGPWLSLSVDHTTFVLVQYLSGRLEPTILHNNLRTVPIRGPPKHERSLAIGESLPPWLRKSIGPGAQPEIGLLRNRSMTKAKVFLYTLALASGRGVDPESFYVNLDTLMGAVASYRRSGARKTNSEYYWTKAAEVVCCLLFDLPSTLVRAQVRRPQDRQPQVVDVWLMNEPNLALPLKTSNRDGLYRIIQLSTKGDLKELGRYLRSVSLKGIVLGLPTELLQVLGTERGRGRPNALEDVAWEVLQLPNCAFWLAYKVAFLRRWAPSKHASAGQSLLGNLEELGYLDYASAKTGERVSYKVALRAWHEDVAALVNISVLDDPGVSIYTISKGRQPDITNKIREHLQNRGTRLTRSSLANLRVIYHLPQNRAGQLERARSQQARRKKF